MHVSIYLERDVESFSHFEIESIKNTHSELLNESDNSDTDGGEQNNIREQT